MAAGRRRGNQNDDTGMFAPVTVARASSSIADQIRAAIVGGKLNEGERLPPERELAEQFGVSRVTVRDALRALEAMGLIEVKVGARGGAFVTVPTGSVVGQTMSDMMLMQALSPEDIVEARLLVELGTITLACARATDEDVARLHKLQTRAEEALARGTYTRELSWEFHSLLAETASNGALEGITHSFRNTLSMHPIRAREGKRAHTLTVQEHGSMVDAIEARDAVDARTQMARHLLRGTGREERESALLALWDTPQPLLKRRAK